MPRRVPQGLLSTTLNNQPFKFSARRLDLAMPQVPSQRLGRFSEDHGYFWKVLQLNEPLDCIFNMLNPHRDVPPVEDVPHFSIGCAADKVRKRGFPSEITVTLRGPFHPNAAKSRRSWRVGEVAACGAKPKRRHILLASILPTTTSRWRFWCSGLHRMWAPSMSAVTVFELTTSMSNGSDQVMSSAILPRRLRTVVLCCSAQGRKVCSIRAASRNEWRALNSACNLLISGVARSGKTWANGENEPRSPKRHEHLRNRGTLT